MDLVHASTHDDCTCMKRENLVSLKNGLNSTRLECAKYDLKLHHLASSLSQKALFLFILRLPSLTLLEPNKAQKPKPLNP